MASCPSCGNDVEKPGLCPECAEDKTNSQLKKRQVSKPAFFGLVFLACFILAAVSLFIFTSFLNAEPEPIMINQGLTDQHDDNSGENIIALPSAGGDQSKGNRREPVAYDITLIKEHPPLHDEDAYVKWMLEKTNETEKFLRARWELSRLFIVTKELDGDRFVEAFLKTPRENFVRKKNISRAYEDTWLPIGYGATITDPDVVSMMTTSLKVEPQHRVLEIGTGSGYQSAILSNLSNYVYTIEIIEPLAKETDQLYNELEKEYPTYKNIKRKLADGFYGWQEYAPFDRIIVTCSIDHLPPPLIKQLSPEGIIVVPIGPPGRQHIMQVIKHVDENGDVTLDRRDVYNGLSVKFIPFRDKEGKSYSNTK